MVLLRAGVAIVFALLTLAPSAWSQGYPVGPEFRINTYTTGPQLHPSVARSASGDFVVVWYSFDAVLFGQRYAASGSPAGAEFQVAGPILGGLSSVAADASGNFVVTWQASDGDYAGVLARRFSGSGVPLGPEFRVNTFTTSYQGDASVAMDGAGNFVVAWESYFLDGSKFGVFGQRYTSSGAPVGPEFRINTFTPLNQGTPSVASSAAGDFVVVWQDETHDGSGFGIFGQRFASSGAPAGPEFRVNTDTIGDQIFPTVASDASGGFVVVWWVATYPLPSSGRVFGQRYAGDGAPLETQFEVSPAPWGKRDPTVASDSSGNFVVAWTGDIGEDGFGIKAQRYDSSGVPLAPEFRVNAYTTNNQSQPSVSVDSLGSFVVVWQDETQDGSGYGIFGQRYSMIVPVELQSFRVE